MFRSVRIALCGVLAALVLPAVAWGQEPPPTAPPVQTELVFEREVFRYPAFERRNPFLALTAIDAGGVRFEQLDLMGIIWAEDRTESVCTLGTGGFTVSEDGSGVQREPGEAWYAHEGEMVGNVRVVEIHPDQIVVEVELFGIMEQRIMVLETRRIGGTS